MVWPLGLAVWGVRRLESEEEQEGHHEAEESHGLGEGESQDGVGEQLLLQTGVPCVADDQRTEHRTDTRPRSSDSYGGGTCPDEFGC